ncbi:MAG: RagB/SusD family nutrient uptake outer membrane protein, partial [Muribaculaceae bacterium]|nr:RagB/SusD family nutrient uptake outer membrane protein [Muribaculaceae bacterium]
MKKFIIKGLASVLAVASLASCSSDYLEVTPLTAVTAGVVQTTEAGVQDAMYGLARAMYYPYTGSEVMSILGMNGEPFIMMFYGDVYGQDYFSYMWGSQMGANFTWETNRSQSSYVPQIGWMYCYNLISQANQILVNIDNIDGDRDRLNFIKAQALTIRAHAYVRLLQIYGPRWEDSNNGEAYVCPLRLTPSTGNAPLEKMNTIIAAIQKDLDDALALLETRPSSVTRYIWEPDEDCTRGVYARFAMLIHKYDKAQEMAKAARAPYKLLTAEQYKSGFAEVMPSYMWANPVEPSAKGIGYYSHGSYYACQGPYPTTWELGAGQINYELYRQIPRGDIRADLFFTPDKLTQPTQLRASSFWNENICNPASMDLSKLNANMKIQLLQFGTKAIPNGDVKKFGQPYVDRSGEPTNPVIAFGAQYKFWGLDMYGTNSFPFMRAEEMLLTEAEAAYYN